MQLGARAISEIMLKCLGEKEKSELNISATAQPKGLQCLSIQLATLLKFV